MKSHSPPIDLKHLSVADYTRQPWKNGHGETQELAVDDQVPYRWRVSMAAIQKSSPFSQFNGYDREIVLLDPTDVSLVFPNGKTKELSRFSPFAFSGDTPITSLVSGPSRDLNLFLLRGVAQGKIYPLHSAPLEEVQLPLGKSHHFLMVFDGRLEFLEPNTNQTGFLKSFDTLWISRKENKELLNLRVQALETTRAFWIPINLK